MNAKKKILALVVIFVIGTVWVILANQFESAMQTHYLPLLQEQKEHGLINVETDNIKIHKYKFQIVMNNFTLLPKTNNLKADFEQVYAWFNPFANSVTFCSSGKVLINSGALGAYVKDSKISIKIDKPLLERKVSDINITVQVKPFELFNVDDNKLLVSIDEYTGHLTGKLDANLYTLILEEEGKGIKPGANYFNWSSKITNKIFGVQNNLNGQAPEMMKGKLEFDEISNSLATYCDSVSEIYGPNSYTGKYAITLNKEYLSNLYYKSIKGEFHLIKETFAFIAHLKEPFNIALNNTYNNNAHTSDIAFALSGDGKEIKGGLETKVDNHYPKDKLPKLIALSAELFAKIANSVKNKRNLIITDFRSEDFNKLAEYALDIKNFTLNASMNYSLEDSNLDGSVKLNFNDYAMELNAKELGKNSYTGTVKLSDPLKLINAKTKFAHDVIVPLVQKMDNNSKTHSSEWEKLIVNVENNGFEALKVLNSSDVKDDNKFEANFTFDPEKFEFKVNNKSFLSILTDDRMLKFLKGLEGIAIFNYGEASKAQEKTMPEGVKPIIFESDD